MSRHISNMRYWLSAIVFLTVSSIAFSSPSESSIRNYGLTFRAHKYIQDERTGLDLSPDRPFHFREGFILDFDLRMIHEDLAFGYVFRIISGEDSSLDLVTNYNSGRVNFILSDRKSTVANLDFHESLEMDEHHWFHVRVVADRNGIRCSVDSVEQYIASPLKNLGKVQILFGKNETEYFYTTDVPPMSVRNIRISRVESPEKAYCFWKMLKHNRNEVYDSVRDKRASVQNGIWEIDWHTKWQKIATIPAGPDIPQVTCDGESSRLFIALADSILVYDMEHMELSRYPSLSGAPFRNGGSQLEYLPDNDMLVSYSVKLDTAVMYDFRRMSWNAELKEPWPPVQNSCGMYVSDHRTLYVFGGYGNHIYNSVLSAMDMDSGMWRRDTLPISPRYLSTIGYSPQGKLMIMGGYGSLSGHQEEFPRNRYDLYEVDPVTFGCRHVADFVPEFEPVSFCNSMIFPEDDVLYTLSFNNSHFMSELRLVSYDVSSNTMKFWADAIPFRFLDLESFADIAIDSARTCLYAVVQNAKGSGINDVSVYRMAYPPLDASYVRQTAERPGYMFWIAVAALLSFLAAGIFLLMRRRRGGMSEESDGDLFLQDNTDILEEENTMPEGKSMIVMLGGLRVFSADGEDITSSMSPIVRQMFLMVILRCAEGEGVTSQMLDETFWLGMDKSQASNNRNVNIRKLRLQLQRIGDMTLSYNNGFWNLNIGEGISCDYMEMMHLLDTMEKVKSADMSLAVRIVSLAAAGPLLPNIEADWLDSYKSRYSERIISTLLRILKETGRSDDSLSARTARAILVHDSIDEDAVRTLCRILYRHGHKGQSKQVYDKFCSDYRSMLGDSPEVTYEEILASL